MSLPGREEQFEGQTVQTNNVEKLVSRQNFLISTSYREPAIMSSSWSTKGPHCNAIPNAFTYLLRTSRIYSRLVTFASLPVSLKAFISFLGGLSSANPPRMHDESKCRRDEVSRPPPYPSVVIHRPKSPPDFDGWGRRAKKARGDKSVRRNARVEQRTEVEGGGCARSPTWFPRMLKPRSRESPRAHYAKAFVHCLSFPRHCAFRLHTRARILACSRHSPAPIFFFFPFRRSLLSSLSFCPLYFPVSLPSPATFRGRGNRVFIFFSPFALWANEVGRHTVFFSSFCFLTLASRILIRSSICVSRSALMTQYRKSAADRRG